MLEGIDIQNPIFVNTLGHTSGLFIFGLLLALMLKSRNSIAQPRGGANLLAAFLAFSWNLSSLVGLAFTQSKSEVADWLVALNFSLLSLLPAVLVSVLVQGKKARVMQAAYAISFSAVALHFLELLFPLADLHEAALLLITIGFGGVGSFLLLDIAKKRGASSVPSAVDVWCLILFTSSFLHFGLGHARTAWTGEIAWHHAGVPLALIVLLRDYRLLLAEAFIRFTANVGLAAFFTLFLYAVIKSGTLIGLGQPNSFVVALLSFGFCLALILFAYLRSLLQDQLTRTVFGRGDLTVHSQRILLAASECDTEQGFLERAAQEIRQFVEADRYELRPDDSSVSASHPDLSGMDARHPRATSWAEIRLPLRFSKGDGFVLLLGRRRGSRRYLPEDSHLLGVLTRLVVQQVERLRANNLQQLANEAELRALQAQINPHFFFNALNTLYGTIRRESVQARKLVLNLADLFRYSLQRNRTSITLGEELQIVQAYLEIERSRLGERLIFEVSASASAQSRSIPALSIQPLVENAIKHGIAKLSVGGRIEVAATECESHLEITVRDNGPGVQVQSLAPGLGIGLQNVRQRVQLCCAAGSDLQVQSSEEGFTVVLKIVQPVRPVVEQLASLPA